MRVPKFLVTLALAASMSTAALTVPVQAQGNLVNEALRAFNHKNYPQANKLIDQYLAKHPKDVQAQYAKAMILHRMGHFIKALQRLELVLKLSPKDHRAAGSYAAINQQAVYHLNQGRTEEAIALANKGVEIMPKWDQREFRVARAGCYFAQGTAYFERWCASNDPEDFRKAMEAWEQTRTLDPTSATQQLVNGINAFIGGNYTLAKKLFDEGLAVRSNNQYLQLWQSFANASVGETGPALNQLNALTALFHRNPLLHLYKGDLEKTTGDFNGAQEEYTTALELRPTDRRIHTALKVLFLCAGHLENGISHYEQLISQDPNNFNLHYQLASLIEEGGRTEAALEVYQKAASMSGITPLQSATAKMGRALIYLEEGKTAEGEACLTPDDLKVLAESKSPLVSLYEAYTQKQLALREKACREALLYSGPDSIFVHRSAFKAWADTEMERKQYLKAMAFIYQVWQRTPATATKRIEALQDQFTLARQEAYKQLQAQMRRASKAKDDGNKEATLKRMEHQLSLLQDLALGVSGTLLFKVQGSTEASVDRLLPEELSSGLPILTSSTVSSSSWVNVVPDWQQ